MTRRRLAFAVALALGLVVIAGIGSTARLNGSAGGAGYPQRPASTSGAAGRSDSQPATDELRSEFQRSVPAAARWILLGALGAVALLCAKVGFPVPPDDSVPDRSERSGGQSTNSLGSADEVTGALVLDAVLAGALGALRDVADPRLAVRCAYSEVADGLAGGGLRRGVAESEAEFLRRALSQQRTDLTAGALGRLTELFGVARFSADPVTEEMRTEAVAHLLTLRAAA